MRKLILQEFVSADGFAADAQGSTRFFESIPKEQFKEIDEDMVQQFHTIDTILLGANTYKMFVDFWPGATADQEIVADALNKTPKIVFSKTLKQAPWGKWEPAHLHGNACEKVKQLKQEKGKDMIVFGSIALAKSLLKDNSIDEIQLRVCPSLLGSGMKFVPDELPLLNMELVQSKTYAPGIVSLTYKPN